MWQKPRVLVQKYYGNTECLFGIKCSTHTNPPSNLQTQIQMQACRWVLCPSGFLQVLTQAHKYKYIFFLIFFFLTGAVVAQVYAEKRKADAVTSTAKRTYFKFILFQDTSVKERCKMRQDPEGLVDALLPS